MRTFPKIDVMERKMLKAENNLTKPGDTKGFVFTRVPSPDEFDIAIDDQLFCGVDVR